MRWLGQAGEMPSDLTKYPGYRFPAEVIQHAVWLYHLDTSKYPVRCSLREQDRRLRL
jgi:hypothetical protein